MESLIFLLIILIIVSLYDWYIKLKNNHNKQAFKDYLTSLDSFEIDLNTVKIDGFNWQENIPVDVYDNELNANDDFLYRTFSYDFFALKNKFHKNTNKAKFSSKLYIPLTHNGNKQVYKLDVPIEHTVIRMKFYQKKSMTAYLDKTKGDNKYILDFTFLENKHLSFVRVY